MMYVHKQRMVSIDYGAKLVELEAELGACILNKELCLIKPGRVLTETT